MIASKDKKRQQTITPYLKEKTILLTISVLLLIIAFIFSKINKIDISWSSFSDSGFFLSFSFFSVILYSIDYLLLLIDVSKSCIKEFKEKHIFNEYLLMIIATIGAYLLCEYLESNVVLIFSLVGEILEYISTEKSKKSISNLLSNDCHMVHLVKGNEVVDTSPNNININDVFVVNPGEKILIDSIVVSGESSLDTSSLTGESLPVYVKPGVQVSSGSIVIDGTLKLKATNIYKNSTFSRLLDSIKNEQKKKTKTENFINKFSSIYTPLVIAIALLVFIIGMASKNFDFKNFTYKYLNMSLSVLLISCPCALVISVPLGFFTSISIFSKYKMLVKGSRYIEKLSKVNCIFFDKTGTITNGKFKLIGEYPKDHVLIAASLEKNSTHPISQALLNEKDKNLLPVSSFKNYSGKGISGVINSKNYLIGNSVLMSDNGINIFNKKENDKNVIYLASIEDGLLETFIIRDSIKEDSQSVIEKLQNLNINCVLLSGDNEQFVKEVSNKCNFNTCYFQKLPSEKAEIIQEYKNNKNIVAYVGDGINDSLSMIKSDVAFSMGKIGCDSAIESSDIVIQNDDLSNVYESIRLAKKTMVTIVLSITVALLIKIVLMILTIFGVFKNWTMLIAAFSDTGALIICILIVFSLYLFKPKTK